MRVKFYFYDEGFARINWGVKHDTGFDVRTLHTFVVPDNPMWGQSDLKCQMQTQGSNIQGNLIATHFKAGIADNNIRENAEGRDGTVLGDGVAVAEGTPIPLVSVELRDGWENVNVSPLAFSVDMDADYYVFLSVGSDLDGATFREPGSDIPAFDQQSSEYAVLADNQATGFGAGGVGSIEYKEYVASGGFFSSSSVADEIDDFGLATGERATLGVLPVGASTLNGSSLRWGMNF